MVAIQVNRGVYSDPENRPFLRSVLLNPSFKHSVHDGLVSLAFGPEPFHYVGVYAQRHDNFRFRKNQFGILEKVVV